MIRELDVNEVEDVAGGPIPLIAYAIGAGLVALVGGGIAIGFAGEHNRDNEAAPTAG